MALRRAVALAGLLLVASVGSVAAQVPMIGGNLPDFDSAPPAPPPGAGAMPDMVAPPPGGPPPGAPGGFPPPPQQSAQQPPCFKEFLPLREAAEKRAGLIKTAADHKAPREEVCQLFKNFAASEAKVVKFVTENQAKCGVPAQVVSQMKSNHDRTLKTRDQICNAASMGSAAAGPPPGPRLSDELGLRGVVGPNNVHPGRGTFDTLTGNALAR
jgi:hypothetical protein